SERTDLTAGHVVHPDANAVVGSDTEVNHRVAGAHDAVANLHEVGELATATDLRDVQRRESTGIDGADRAEQVVVHVEVVRQATTVGIAVAAPQVFDLPALD